MHTFQRAPTASPAVIIVIGTAVIKTHTPTRFSVRQPPPRTTPFLAHVLHYPHSPHANSFIIGTAVINTHTLRNPPFLARFCFCKNNKRTIIMNASLPRRPIPSPVAWAPALWWRAHLVGRIMRPSPFIRSILRRCACSRTLAAGAPVCAAEVEVMVTCARSHGPRIV